MSQTVNPEIDAVGTGRRGKYLGDPRRIHRHPHDNRRYYDLRAGPIQALDGKIAVAFGVGGLSREEGFNE